MAPAVGGLTEAQAAVYDRQLRVWGVEVQRRLMDARVLIVGLGGLAAEIAKNIVLAGVGTVALMDDTPAAAAAPGNFLVEHEEAGSRTVAEACARTLAAMNPLMAVTVEPGSLASLTEARLTRRTEPDGTAAAAAADCTAAGGSGYDVVVACGLGLGEVGALDALCRAAGVALFAAGVRGASAAVFVDLGPSHTYTLKGQPGELTLPYPTFTEAISADLRVANKRTHPMYPAMQALWAFEQAHGRPPSSAADVPAVQHHAAQLLAAAALPPAAAAALQPPGLIEVLVCDGGEEMAAVAAVAGGVVANNVLRAVSRVNRPLCNWFFYSLLARDGLGLEECFPAPAPQPKAQPAPSDEEVL